MCEKSLCGCIQKKKKKFIPAHPTLVDQLRFVFQVLTFIPFFHHAIFRYIKYLYPYECETKNLSSPEELHLAVDINRRDARTPVAGTPQTPGTPHTPVRLLMDPNQASLAAQTPTNTPSTATAGEPAAKKPRMSAPTATPVAQAIAAGSISTATLAALPTTPYCNIRISHGENNKYIRPTEKR